ncbi:sigma-70 family RNA polymerase sigma factor [uncultured Sphingobacterium sp.]|uniref:RNA polymerase sigma factor n=1 Tax=uncultured Sphingobacterium sp. TaxID=182688 RepID=UPI001AE91450|nr:sigma-70 family RNA polymerase sigma factor [uncultured Sphingobacterium sp.]
MNPSEIEFLRLIDENKGILVKVSRLYMDDHDGRQDLYQEIVYQLWKSYGTFKRQSKFSTWMYRVALNTAMVFLKKEKKHQIYDALDERHDAADEGYDADKDEQLKVFYQAVQELNAIEKALIFLFLEGQSHREIAENLGISEVNARVKLNRTKERIQQIIKKYNYEF